MKKYFCLDCKKEISRNSKRCKSCVGKMRDYSDRKHPLIRKDIKFEDVKRLYCKENKNLNQIANIYGCYPQAISYRLKKMGIKMNGKQRSPLKKYFCMDCGKEVNRSSTKRCFKCDVKFHIGKNARRYVDGSNRICYQRIAYEGKEKKCETCGARKNICVHHIDFNHRNNKKENLIILCKSCHCKTHKRHLNFGKRPKIKKSREFVDNLIKEYDTYKNYEFLGCKFLEELEILRRML